MNVCERSETGFSAYLTEEWRASLGLGVPATDGIVGVDGNASLLNLGRLARRGMADTAPFPPFQGSFSCH